MRGWLEQTWRLPTLDDVAQFLGVLPGLTLGHEVQSLVHPHKCGPGAVIIERPQCETQKLAAAYARKSATAARREPMAFFAWTGRVAPGAPLLRQEAVVLLQHRAQFVMRECRDMVIVHSGHVLGGHHGVYDGFLGRLHGRGKDRIERIVRHHV
jgi:hypothetical protein